MVTKLSTAPFTLAAMFTGALVPMAFVVAIFADGSWSFNVNTLSDLGISSDDMVAKLFMATCIIAGILMAVFGLGKLLIKHKFDSAAGFLIVLAGVMLVGVGLFDKTTSVHPIIALLYFLFVAIAMFVSAYSEYINRRYLALSITIIAIVVSLSSLVALALPGAEVICVGVNCVWMISEAVSLTFSNDYNEESDNRTVTA